MSDWSVSAAYARGMIDLAVSKGASRATLLARARLHETELADPDVRIPFEKYVTLVRAGKEDTADPALALHYGEGTDISEVSIIGLIGRASETMLDALVQINRYVRLVVDVEITADVRFVVREERAGLWLVDTRASPDAFPELTESAFAQLICSPRNLGLPPFTRAVRVTHPRPEHGLEYERVFQAPVSFGADANAILVDPRILSYRVERLPRHAFGVLTGHADTLLERLDSAQSSRGQVEHLLMSMLHTGQASIEVVTDRLGISRQTLYRRLKTEGVTFEQVLDELRQRLAMQYLDSDKVSVNETAYLVGFSDPAAFSRAFKRWTGRSPRDWRCSRS